jgi:hypothetical protein
MYEYTLKMPKKPFRGILGTRTKKNEVDLGREKTQFSRRIFLLCTRFGAGRPAGSALLIQTDGSRSGTSIARVGLQTDKQTDRKINRQTDKQTERQVDRRTEGTDRLAYRQTDRKKDDIQTDKQTDNRRTER